MRWPLVSVHWRDAYLAEREEVRRLTDALIRMERVREGLPELPPEKRKPVEPIPLEIELMIDQMWRDEHAKKAERVNARRLFEKLGDWDKVKAEMMGALQEVGE